MSANRRIINRWQVDLPAAIKLEGQDEASPCQVKDINFKGIQIFSREKLPVDSFIKITILLDKEHILDIIKVWVAWHKTIDGHNVYGLYFHEIKDGDKDKIYKFIQKTCPHLICQQWWQGIEQEGGERMQEKSMDDRRIFERIPAKFPLRFLDLNSNKEQEAEVEDISAKGLGFMASERLEPLSTLEMWLKVPDRGEPLYTRGEVAWSKMVEPSKYRIGVNLEKADLMGFSRILRAA